MQLQKEQFSSAQMMKFVLPSLLGAIVFLMPIPVSGSLNTILGVVIDIVKAALKPWLAFTAMFLVCLGGAASLWACTMKPKAVMENEFFKDLLIVSPFWLLS